MPLPASPTDPDQAPPAAEALLALARLSHGALALVAADGRLQWANPAFAALAAAPSAEAPGGASLDHLLVDDDAPGWFARQLHGSGLAQPVERSLRRAADDARLCLSISLAPLEPGRPEAGYVVALSDITAQRRAEAHARHQAELLDTAQEFGRLGVWERDIRTLEGRWDRHVFRFWSLDPAGGTPNWHVAARSIHPDDAGTNEVFKRSLLQAGTYATHYRVCQPNGGIRLIHSQWEVKNGADGRPERVVGVMMDDTEVTALAKSYTDTHEQLQLAVDLAHIAVWRHDLATNRMHYNQRAWEILDLPPRPEGLALEEVRALIHPDDLPGVVASAERALRSGTPVDVEARYRRRDGSWRYILTRRVVQRDASGQPVAHLGVALDITQQVEGSRKALELARRLETATRAGQLGLWNIDTETGVLEWNDQMLELYGLTPETRPRTFVEWLERCVHPEDRARVKSLAVQWQREGDDLLEIEYRTQRPDGSVRWLVNRSDIDRRAETPLVFGVTLDVTEHHEAIERLRDASERSALAARGIGMGTWEQDLVTGKAFWDEQMFLLRGLPPRDEALSAEERLALVHPDDRDHVVVDLDRALAQDRPATYEFRVRLPDGSYRWLASRSTTVFDNAGRPARRIGVNWDITDSKTAEIARQEKAMVLRESQAKSQFLARMSHELRTPLNAVLGFTQLLMADGEQVTPEVRQRRLEHIRHAGEHLLSLINDVLDLSSVDTGEMRMDLVPVPLPELVNSSLPLMEPLAQQHRVQVQCGALEGVPLADPTRLRQIVLNLLSNGIKYNRPGGTVTISAGLEPAGAGGGRQVCLCVSDTGRGMTEEQLRHAFEPFNRLGLEREGIEGTGIGLAIVKALVERMGGSVRVHSEAGIGSHFEVRLPHAPDVDAVRTAGLAPGSLLLPLVPAGPPQAAGSETVRPGRLLYIEDNAVNVLIVSELVAMRPGLTLDVASDGESGVTRAGQLQPDLVLVDMQLPGIDGHEVLRRLRSDPRTAHIPCIALSANAMPQDIERALHDGFADYWTKPLDFKAFMASLDALFLNSAR